MSTLDLMSEKSLVGQVVARFVEVKSTRIDRRCAEPPEVLAPAHERENRAHLGTGHAIAAHAISAAAAGLRQAPSGENMRERYHVGLRVSAVNSESMQLHQLARVVLVDALELALRAGTAGRSVLPVVEIKQHRRMMRGRAQQRAELAHRMRPDGGLLEGAGPDVVEALAGKDVEVIEPEGGHHFLQLARAFDRAHHPRLDRLAHHDPLLDSQVLGRVFDHRLVAAALGLDLLARLENRPLVLGEQRDRGHVQGLKLVDGVGQITGDRNRLRVQLLLHVMLGANRADHLEISGPGPEGETV
jgi:hypothetical protein